MAAPAQPLMRPLPGCCISALHEWMEPSAWCVVPKWDGLQHKASEEVITLGMSIGMHALLAEDDRPPLVKYYAISKDKCTRQFTYIQR